jgi:hypothetical protein
VLLFSGCAVETICPKGTFSSGEACLLDTIDATFHDIRFEIDSGVLDTGNNGEISVDTADDVTNKTNDIRTETTNTDVSIPDIEQPDSDDEEDGGLPPPDSTPSTLDSADREVFREADTG